MGFRKFRADRLFTGFALLEQQVLITDEQGKVAAVIPEKEAGEGIEYFPGILSPGFINCHCHLELSHLKGAIPEHTGLTDFLLNVITRRAVAEEQVLDAIARAEEEMHQNGIVAVGDICNTTHTLVCKQAARLYYHNFVEAIGFNPSAARQRFEAAAAIYRALTEISSSVRQASIVPHAPYSVTEELWQLISGFEPNPIQCIHNQETLAEDEWFTKKQGDFAGFYRQMGMDTSFFVPSGKSSLQTCLQRFRSGRPLILVHNVCTTQEDMAYIKSARKEAPTFSCLCPNANLYIGNQIPDIPMLVEKEATLVLGTDSLASNHQLNILEEIRSIRHHFPGIETAAILQWATLNGAKALLADEVFGSFEPGKKPGIILLDKELTRVSRLL